MGGNNVVTIKAYPFICQVVFHQDNPEFSPAVLTDDMGGTYPPSDAGGAPVAQVPTKSTTPKIFIPMAIRGGKSSSNRTRPMDDIDAESELAANFDIDFKYTASSVTRDADLYYSG